jgi:adenine-specific DNA-methyltransferase
MPTLHWIGKEKVVNHHQDVLYRVLEHQYGFDAEQEESSQHTESGNKIIHGDNLEALKSLLPEYEGKIKCIYIDPPYNTGNENWVYNDNVNHPKIKKWLGEVVGKEGDDLSRHDKWLCMMYPRLKLLHKLLADDGAIFISIDDEELIFLTSILDEIFGERNHVSNLIWQRRTSPDSRLQLSTAHDYILCYSKNIIKLSLGRLDLTEKQKKRYRNPDDNPRGPWASTDFTAQGHRPNQMYVIKTPGGEEYEPPPGRCWANIEPVYENLRDENRLWFGKDGTNRPRIKNFLKDAEGNVPWTWLPHEEVGHNQEAKKEVNSILGHKNSFDTPKPSRLIERIIKIGLDGDGIILDSFAGSGITAHAVQNLNEEDGGNRKFILVEMEEYANSITAERIKRVMKGYGNGKKKTEGTGGSFDYYQLGQPLFDENDLLNEEVEESRIREYVWYSETKTAFPKERDKDAHKHVLGTKDETDYYFFYEKDAITTLNHDFLATIKQKADQYVIYADNCLLSKEFLQSRNIIFKKIPRDISRF